MEELRSTEILDKEIVSDAEKKAAKIEKNAAVECVSIEASVQGRVDEEIRKFEDNYINKLKLHERDLNASVPLEKSRFYVSFVQDSIIREINSFISNVSEDKLISLLCRKCRDVSFGSEGVRAFVYGFDKVKTEKALKEIIGNQLISIEKTEFNKILIEESFLEKNMGIILFSESNGIKCRFTLCSAVEDILDKYRSELAEALFENKSE